MKKTIVKLLFIVFIISIMAGNLNSCYAREDETGTVPKSGSSSTTSGSSQIIDPNVYTPTGDTSNNESLKGAANAILTAIRVIGVVVLVVTLAIIGLKYMLGSVEEKAEYKKTMLPYLIGALLTFSGTQLVQFIYNVMSK